MRNLKRLIYTSSYDRGLEHLLKIWPDIKKEVPDAILDIYYGWQLFLQFYKDNPGSMSWHDKMAELMKQEGVTDHGRIPQKQLIEEYKSAGIFAYPCHFGEINCMSAIKAQAYGAVPVITNSDHSSLGQIVQFGIKVTGDIYDKEVLKTYKDQLIWLLKHPEWQDKVRRPMMEWGSKITWEAVSKQWTELFRGKQPSSVITVPQEPIVKIIDGERGELYEK